MQIPLELQKFSEPTLIVLTDGQRANLLIAGGDTLEALDGIVLLPEEKSDHESSFVGEEQHDTPRKEHFAKSVAERITSLVREKHASVIYLASLPEMLHRIEGHLAPDVASHVKARLSNDLLNLSHVEVLQRFLAKP